MGVLPIVNENDTVVTDEIRLGDNDTLAALVANLVDADALLILTDQDGLMDRDPRQSDHATLIESADVHDPDLDIVAGTSSALGRGGMATKLSAARLAARSGTGTVIANGRLPDVIAQVTAGHPLGTFLHTRRQPQSARKQWLASLLHAKGTLVLDEGAVRVSRSRVALCCRLVLSGSPGVSAGRPGFLCRQRRSRASPWLGELRQW